MRRRSFERYSLMALVRFGGDLLSHVLRRSTISAAALNGRVRDGIGCFARAMTTKSNKGHQVPSQAHVFMCVCILIERSKVLLLLDQIKPIGRLVPVN